MPAMFYTQYSDIVTITNLTVKNHYPNIFCLQSVLTQKFYNCTFTNITIVDGSKHNIIIVSTREQDDSDRNNTEQPVTIFQDLHVDVIL